MTGGQRLSGKLLRDSGIRSLHSSYAVRPHHPSKDRAAHAQGRIEEILAVGVEHVEEPGPQHFCSGRRRPEAAHRLLEGARPAVLVERQRLAVEDE